MEKPMIPDLYDRRLGFGEIFKAGWGIFFRNFKYLFVFGFVLSVILKALDFLAFMPFKTVVHDKVMVLHLSRLISGIFGFIGCLIAVVIAGQVVAGKKVSWVFLLENFREFFCAGFAIHIIIGLISVISWLPDHVLQFYGHQSGLLTVVGTLFALAGMVLFVYFTFTFQTLVLRGHPWQATFGYSFRMVRGRWWKIFGMTMVLVIVLMIPVVGLTMFFKRLLHITAVDGLSVAYPFSMFFGMYAELFFTVLFVNLDRQTELSCNPV